MLSRDRPDERKSKLVQLDSSKRMFPFAQRSQRHGQVGFVDLPGDQPLVKNATSPTLRG
jgi:hypothetical protein